MHQQTDNDDFLFIIFFTICMYYIKSLESRIVFQIVDNFPNLVCLYPTEYNTGNIR